MKHPDPDEESDAGTSAEETLKKTSKKRKSTEAKEAKPKRAKPSDANGAKEAETNDDGDAFLKLSDTRRLTVRKYNGKVLVDFREYYRDKATGALKPGSKGLSLSVEQWETVKASFAQVDEMIAQL